ncbi:hypothetical protein ZIOFF_014865 [Zingiber officinale]|uniref:Uncharacterized protein n=1 Tax=Zingiber officinale TaxID=94328 RepID=A0A8J5HBG8_ZINOF|nr:hypothetical protein ZIOFF_014865 [Zingiber officinale]
MANHFHAIIFISLLFAFLSSFNIVVSSPDIVIEGRVYCDTCRAGFETTATTYMEGIEATTDSSGTYKLSVEHDHQEESCAIQLAKSSQNDCSEINDDRNSAPVVITHNVGIASNVRHANSLGFLKDQPLSNCGQILMQYALGTEE